VEIITLTLLSLQTTILIPKITLVKKKTIRRATKVSRRLIRSPFR
jgi:hypothetical protein